MRVCYDQGLVYVQWRSQGHNFGGGDFGGGQDSEQSEQEMEKFIKHLLNNHVLLKLKSSPFSEVPYSQILSQANWCQDLSRYLIQQTST